MTTMTENSHAMFQFVCFAQFSEKLLALLVGFKSHDLCIRQAHRQSTCVESFRRANHNNGLRPTGYESFNCLLKLNFISAEQFGTPTAAHRLFHIMEALKRPGENCSIQSVPYHWK